jgi:hypothetical protein
MLKEQLDDALENNDIIEQLTERNLKLSEVVLYFFGTFPNTPRPWMSKRLLLTIWRL